MDGLASLILLAGAAAVVAGFRIEVARKEGVGGPEGPRCRLIGAARSPQNLRDWQRLLWTDVPDHWRQPGIGWPLRMRWRRGGRVHIACPVT